MFPYGSVTWIDCLTGSAGIGVLRWFAFRQAAFFYWQRMDSERFVDEPTKQSRPGKPTSASDRSYPAVDRRIVDRVRLRDSEALGVFFEHYFDRIFGLAFRLLSDRAAAEDATQEVFCKIHRAAPSLDPERDPLPWLITITLNTCRSFWRSASHKMSRRAIALDADRDRPFELPDPGSDPADDLLTAQREAQVQEAIRELPESLRIVVVLHDYQGLDHKEIAAILEIGHDAVRKRYSRALAELGRILGDRLQ